MSKFIGRRLPVGFGVEGTRGTGVAADYVLSKTSYDLLDKANKARIGEGLGSISAEGAQAIVAQQFGEGSVEFEFDARSLHHIMKCVFGALSSAAQGSDYKHTATLLESNQHPSMSVHLDNPNGDAIFEGAMVDSFEFTVTPEEIVKGNMGLKSFPSRSDAYSASPQQSFKFVGRDLEFKVAAAIGDLAAASAVSVKSLTLTVSKNTAHDWVDGTLEPEDILNKAITIQGSIQLNYEDDTWRDYMLDGDYKAVGIKLKNTRETMGGENPEFYLELPRVDFSEWERDDSNDEIVTQTINFTALYNIATSLLISDCYVVNPEAS